MKLKYLSIILLIFSFYSCKNENEKRQAASIKDIKKKELILATIDKSWIFNLKPILAQPESNQWKEWNSFLDELDRKPKKTLADYQKKSTELSKKIMALELFIPTDFNNSQIKSRTAILITKVRMLDLYLHLSVIPDQKVVALLPEINQQIIALHNQMSEMATKSRIPLEEGESDLLKMLDSARAIPNTPQLDPNSPRVE